MPLLALIAIFIAVPIAELYVIWKVGDAIGVLPTLAILAADSLLGTWLLRSQGRAVWNRFNATLSEGRVPHREVIDGVLIIFGGAFLITPGFLTDVIGVLLLLPPTRAAFRRVARRSIERGTVIGAAGRAARRRGRPHDYDVEGTASDVDWDTPRLPR